MGDDYTYVSGAGIVDSMAARGAEDVSQVEQQIRMIDDGANGLEKLLALLSEKLTPVLHDQGPIPATSKLTNKDVRPLVPLASRLHVTHCRLAEQLERLHSIIHRVDL